MPVTEYFGFMGFNIGFQTCRWCNIAICLNVTGEQIYTGRIYVHLNHCE